jgi:transcriptional regulator GlxA family with amidase domain
MIAAPLTDAFIQALLMAADHPDRGLIASDAKYIAPQHIRAAVDIIEAEPQLPLTVSSLAARCHISARALQQGFDRHLGVSPMTYLRQVRLRRARRELLDRDPSVETVASVARRWGFAHPGRFAAVYSARYGETPAMTLRRATPQPPTRRLDA